MSRYLLPIVFVTISAVSALSQMAYVLVRSPGSYDVPAAAVWLPNAAYPAGIFAPALFRPSMPNWYAGSIAATGTPLPPVANEGGLAIDQVTSIIYGTDGTSYISQDSHSLHSSAAAPAATVALPLPGAPPGAITGLAVDPDSGFLWICTGTMFQARSKIHPYPAMTAPLPIPPFIGGPGATGLGFDPATATLWACSAAGATVQFTMSGAPVSSHPPLPVPHAAVRGLDVNPVNGAGSFPPPAGQTPGFHICVTDGFHVFDALPPYASISANAGLESYCRGLAISATPAALPGGFNPATGYYRFDAEPAWAPYLPQIGLTRPTVSGPVPSPCAVTLSGAPAGSPVLLAAAAAPLPATATAGGIIVGSDVLWLNPLAPTFALLPSLADATGSAAFILPLEAAPSGLQLCVQWLVADSTAYLGWTMTDALMLASAIR